MNECHIKLEISIPEPFGMGEFSYEFLDLCLLYSKLSLLAQHKYDTFYHFNDLSYRRRISEFSRDEKLFVESISKNSPIKIQLGAWVPKAITALAEFLERIHGMPEKKERARLENEARKIEIALDVVERMGLDDLSKNHKIALANELLYDISNISGKKKRIKVLSVSPPKSQIKQS